MSMLAIRSAQAGLAIRILESMTREVGPDKALGILAEAIENDSRSGGEAFARLAPEGPCLEHFSTVLERWRAGGALTIENVELEGTTLSFAVTNCGYARAYADMGIAPDVGAVLSCSRDEPFAQGYSPKLTMQRTQTIMNGAPSCLFTFTWKG
jgi:hypothetical protein